MSPEAAVRRAVARAERILPGTPAAEGERDLRWQAIIRVGEFIETQPDAVWQFAHRWGKHAQRDLRSAVATCLLEHLLEHHFERVFPRVRQAALESVRFADTFSSCWAFGQSKGPKNAARIRRLQNRLRRAHAASPPSGITRRCSGLSRRISFAWFESRHGAGSATDRHAVIPLMAWRTALLDFDGRWRCTAPREPPLAEGPTVLGEPIGEGPS